MIGHSSNCMRLLQHICIGSSHEKNFLKLFGYGENPQKIPIRPKPDAKNQNNRYLRWVKPSDNSETQLFIIGFSTSMNGPNSDYLLRKFGEKIAELSGSAD